MAATDLLPTICFGDFVWLASLYVDAIYPPKFFMLMPNVGYIMNLRLTLDLY